MNISQRLKGAIAKVNKLIEQNRHLLVRNQELESEVARLKNAIGEETRKTAELHNQIKIIKLARNIGSSKEEGADVAELKKKLNEYIREIDQCVSLLND